MFRKHQVVGSSPTVGSRGTGPNPATWTGPFLCAITGSVRHCPRVTRPAERDFDQAATTSLSALHGCPTLARYPSPRCQGIVRAESMAPARSSAHTVDYDDISDCVGIWRNEHGTGCNRGAGAGTARSPGAGEPDAQATTQPSGAPPARGTGAGAGRRCGEHTYHQPAGHAAGVGAGSGRW